MKKLVIALLATFAALALAVGITNAAPGGPGRGPGGGGVSGQVTSIDGSTINVKTPRDTTSAIVTTSSTTFELDGASSSLSAIAAGQYVRAEGSKATDGTFTATKVVASTTAPQAPKGGPRGGRGVGGQVASVSGSTINVKTPDGSTSAIVTTSSTTFVLDGKSSSLSAIAAGQYVRAEGSKATNGTFTATKVVASTTAPQAPKDGGQRGGHGVGGQVTSVSGSTINVKTPDGSTNAIVTTSSTTFELDGAASSLSAIAAGQYVRAEGSKATDGTFTATKVVASTTAPQPPKEGGPRGTPTATATK